MSTAFDRRAFVAGSIAAAGLGAARAAVEPEFYELRTYRNADVARRAAVSDYVERALLPALGRLRIDRVGVFTPSSDKADGSLLVLVPYKSLDLLATLGEKLAADGDYRKAAEPYFALPKQNPPYARIESSLMRAFAGLPVLEAPPKGPRIFELRTYESHNEEKARLKVEMFNSGEIDLMKETKLGPVFFGETLVAANAPNLTYMLSAADADQHKAHWKAFAEHPKWKEFLGMTKYKDTVSKSVNTFLEPTVYSQV